MKLGMLTSAICNLTLDETLQYCSEIGLEAVEIGCGGIIGIHHCDPEILLNDEAAFEAFKQKFSHYSIEISAFSCHGNPVHPVKEIADRYDQAVRSGILLAEKMNIDTICGFSGCPGSEPQSIYPHWHTVPWFAEATASLEWQWEERLIPYWTGIAQFAREHGVKHIALEMHPGFCVYNPETLLRLREACGPEIGANFDPSHLIWQGIDPVQAIRKLSGAIYHFHAKDTFVDPVEMGKNGFFDPIGAFTERYKPFSFRIPGNGTSVTNWHKILVALGQSGYDGVVSIEHEDNTRGQDEGIRKSVAFLKDILIRELPSNCWWKASITEYQRTFLPKVGGTK